MKQMTQIFILGSSSAYGVGDTEGGWGELLKKHYHKVMYDDDGIGEKIEVYNFSKSGATIDFIIGHFPDQLKLYNRGGKIITIILVGGNDSKAVETPNNYVSTEKEYALKMDKLIRVLKEQSTHVIAVDHGFVDESKTNPIHNPFIGRNSYFTNRRRRLFGDIYKKICLKNGVYFADIPVTENEWLRKYLFKDGLHPNKKGHEYIFRVVLNQLKKLEIYKDN